MNWLKRMFRVESGNATYIPPAPDECAPADIGAGWGVPVIKCEWCGSAKDLNVHHIIPQHIRPDLSHDKANMIVLCRPCHFTIGHRCNWSSGGTTNITRMIEEGKR